MKKIVTGIALAAVVLTMGASSAFAGTRSFIDENGDGVCDNRVRGGLHSYCAGGERRNFTDEDGDGICDNAGANRGNRGAGQYFTDENGDGVCDNKTNARGARNGRNK